MSKNQGNPPPPPPIRMIREGARRTCDKCGSSVVKKRCIGAEYRVRIKDMIREAR